MKDKIIIQFEKAEPEKIKINETIRLVVSGGVELRLNKENGVLSLYDKKGTLLSEVDFPTEKIITNAYYDDTTKELVIDFENANQVRIPIDFNDEIAKLEQKIEEFKAIRDVEELPKSGWSGTPVPTGGYVENIYLNTSLSVDKVVSLLRQLTYDYYNGFDFLAIALSLDNSQQLIVRVLDNGYAIMDLKTQYVYFSSNTSGNLGITFTGWNSDFNGVIGFNNSIYYIWDSNMPYQNEQLSSLFSITPFTYSNVNENVLYRVEENIGLQGRPQLYHFKDSVPYKVGLTKEDVIDIINEQFENAEEGAY